MIPRNAEPIGHVSPLPRVDLGARRVVPDDPNWVLDQPHVASTAELAEQARIWALVKQSAQGTNAPQRAPAPIDTSGWDCA